MDMKFPYELYLRGNFISISQLAATLAIAKMKEEGSLKHFFAEKRRIYSGRAGAQEAHQAPLSVIPGNLHELGATSAQAHQSKR